MLLQLSFGARPPAFGPRGRYLRALILGVTLAALGLVGTLPAMAQIVDPSVPSGSPVYGGGTTTPPNNDQNGQNSNSDDQRTTYDPYQPVEIGSGLPDSRNSNDTTDDLNRRRTSTNDTLLDVDELRLKAPPKPGEFEKYVNSAVGRTIPRFGSDLLINAQRDFAVPAAATIPPDYALNVGDKVSISLTGSVEGSADFTIDRNGRITIPKVGTVSLIGVRFRDLKSRVAQALGRQYRGYDVSVSIKELRGVRVYVTGFANNPGAFTVNSLSTLVNAILAAGGPSAGGSFRNLQLIRNGRILTAFDLYDLLRSGNRSRDPLLQNEDVIFIPPVGEQVAVIGSANEEAIYEAKPGETILDLVRYAGGPTSLADPSRVILYRLADKNTIGSREIQIGAARSEPVTGGDILQLLSTGSLAAPLERQSVIVRLEGEVNKPGNYFVAPGTSLDAILNMAGGLTSRAFVYGAKLTRASVRDQQREGFRDALSQLELTVAGSALVADRTIDAGERATQAAAAQALVARMRQMEPDGRLVLSIPYGTGELPRDLIMENNDRLIIPPLVNTVGVFGSVYRPASFLIQESGGKLGRIRDYVERAGGANRFADTGRIFVVHANGEVQTRRRGAFNQRVQPGDVIFVPVKTQSGSLLAKLRDIATIIGQFGFAAAAIATLN